jgi:hypothetical protein
MSGANSTNGRGEIHTKFWPENMKGRNHSEDLGVNGEIISDWILGK